MRPLLYDRAATDQAAVLLASAGGGVAPTLSPVQFLAGGTNIVDFMKLDSWRADHLVDINDLAAEHGRIEVSADGLRLGALVRMSQAAEDPVVNRDYPVIAETLKLAASAQLRNMASLGGNVLQRTRCNYFREANYAHCNKRVPGSGCAALDGVNRQHAVLGTSEECISTYLGDFAQAGPWIRRSTYTKVRDRESYQYGLATAAVALDLAPDKTVREARIGLGGVAYKPWRAHGAEAFLKGKQLDEATAAQAGRVAFEGARPRGANAYKLELGARALLAASTMEA